LPKLKIEEGSICGECQIGEQTVSGKDVVPDVDTSLDHRKGVDAVVEKTVQEDVVEKDVGTTVTPSDWSDEDTETDQEGAT
ncbi:hypothetical protein L195_g063451, partial [Trifolium pratense]